MQFFLYRKGLSACMCPSNPTLPSIARSGDETNEELQRMAISLTALAPAVAVGDFELLDSF